MIGRKEEVKKLLAAIESEQSEFVAVYGRRRVGNTFLINETYGGRYAFQHAGVEKAAMKEQLEYFRQSIMRYGEARCPRLRNWREAFFELSKMLERKGDGKKIVFIDEAPWLDTARSGFLSALENFWNGWASLRKDVVLVICGSATSWVINEVLRNRGGLYNRVTKEIPVAPFTLKECEEYAKWKNLPFGRWQLAECYMALGGVAYYWSLLNSEHGVAQNFDNLFFKKNAELRDEFTRLFASLFKHSEKYVELVTTLGARKCGMTREELLATMPSAWGGEISRYLKELEECGFVAKSNIIGTVKKGAIYRVIDNFTMFYFEFLKSRKGTEERYWEMSYNEPRINSWRGRAFERICLWHLPQIRQALGISGMKVDAYSWRAKSFASGEQDAQIDLLLERADRTISICEIKFADKEYAFSQTESEKLSRRCQVLFESMPPSKAKHIVAIAPYGVRLNANSAQINAVVTLEQLFT